LTYILVFLVSFCSSYAYPPFFPPPKVFLRRTLLELDGFGVSFLADAVSESYMSSSTLCWLAPLKVMSLSLGSMSKLFIKDRSISFAAIF